MAVNLEVQVHFDTTSHQITFSGDINDQGQILFPAADQVGIITLTLDTSAGARFPTLLGDGQNALTWDTPYVQTGWTRPGDDTLLLTALSSVSGVFSYGFTVWVNFAGGNYPSPDPSIANTDIPIDMGVDAARPISSGAAASVAAAA